VCASVSCTCVVMATCAVLAQADAGEMGAASEIITACMELFLHRPLVSTQGT
jgi:hypothetical protein